MARVYQTAFGILVALFGRERNALRSHPNVNAFSRGHLVYATYVIAVREPNPQGEGERSTANHSGSFHNHYDSSSYQHYILDFT